MSLHGCRAVEAEGCGGSTPPSWSSAHLPNPGSPGAAPCWVQTANWFCVLLAHVELCQDTQAFQKNPAFSCYPNTSHCLSHTYTDIFFNVLLAVNSAHHPNLQEEARGQVPTQPPAPRGTPTYPMLRTHPGQPL